MVGSSILANSFEAGVETAKNAMKGIKKPKIGFLFTSIKHNQDELIRLLSFYNLDDDFAFDEDQDIEPFEEDNADIVYANGIYVDPDNLNLEVRRWKGGAYRRWKVRVGWLPLHTTVFIKRDLFAKLGYYDEAYKIASDSDLLVRYLYRKDVKIGYLDRYVVKMRMGGLSTDAKRRWQMMEEDLRMYRTNHFEPAFMTKICKMSWKVPQFVKAKIINTVRQFEKKKNK